MNDLDLETPYARYYFFINDDGLLTVQLTNEPLHDCVTKTAQAIAAYSDKREGEK